MPGSAGATEKPQWPMISVVTPWRTLLSAFGLIGSVKSECVLMSMKPGATARPCGVDDLECRTGEAGPDRRDAAAGDGEIAGNARIAGAVVQNSAADQDVVHALVIPDCRASGSPESILADLWLCDSGFRALRGPRNDAHGFMHSAKAGPVALEQVAASMPPFLVMAMVPPGQVTEISFSSGLQVRSQLLLWPQPVLAQRVQAARAWGAGWTRGTDRPGLAFDALRPLRPSIALRPRRSLRAVETAGQRERRDESDNCQ